MKFFRTKSLRQRFTLFLIIPVALLLFLTGLSGFFYSRQTLLEEWREAAILKLQRAAHHIDMRLSKPIEWVNMFHRTAGGHGGASVQDWILNQLRELEGVSKVRLKWRDDKRERVNMMHGSHMSVGRMMRFHRARISKVMSPRYDAESDKETVALISDLRDESDRTVGKLEVLLRFDYLMQDIIKLGWWQSELACLVDKSGRYLAHTKAMEKRKVLGETNDPVELTVLKKIQKQPFGTYLGVGHPPELVSGFYSTNQAPWVIVMFAPGKKILEPISQFLLYYILAECICLIFILLLIRFLGGGLVRSIRQISEAAKEVAKGRYGKPLSVKGSDEMGQLTGSFNEMVVGLKQKDFITNTFGRYVDHEIAEELMKRPEAARLGGEKREVAILMSDIREFTTIAETLSPEGTINLLNHYFSHMIELIQRHKGIIVDFFGDGILVFFDPLEGTLDRRCRQAISCAFEMQESMRLFNEEIREENLPQIQMGIGINAGEVVVGNIGSESRAKYGIVGSAVNITQRIQSYAKGGEVVLSETVYQSALDYVDIKKTHKARLRGIKESATLYVMKGFREQEEAWPSETPHQTDGT